MKRLAFVAASLVLLGLWWVTAHSSAAKEQWVSVQSKNFLLVGNASERDIRRVGVKLEQFREVFAQLFPKANVNSAVPIRVVVFKNRSAYLPFMPIYQGKVNEVGGYFQPGQDVNYITLTAELSGQNPYRTIFHEYVHALLNDTTVRPPVWFNEGLAEFYSTFEVANGDRKVTLGKPIASHVFLLRENKFLPLARLFAVNHGDPEYNERDKKGVFYAEAWALVHSMLLGNGGQRQPQFLKYLSLLANGTAIGEAFQTAFQTDFATLEKELRDYTNRSSYPVQEFTLSAKLEFDSTMQSAPVSEAEAQYYLGDLVVHMNRTDGAAYLEKAIALDPNLAVAHASLGVAKMRAKQFVEAKRHLQRAVELNSQNYLVSYYYAQALLDELSGETHIVSEIPEATAQIMRTQLRKTIALKPDFADAYRLLGLVNLVTNEHLDESVALLKRAIQLTPGRDELGTLLSQLYLRQEKYEDARRTLEPLATSAAEPRIRQQAQTMLDAVNRMAEMRARFPAQQETATRPAPRGAQSEMAPARPALRRRFEGEKAEGVLTRVDCNDKGITLTVKGAQRSFTLHTATPERLQFITYSQEMGTSFTCGTLNPAPRVVVTYRTSTDARAGVDGEPIGVEFVKEGK
jgi:tetratricopeptide (TPR) repeat protein